MFFILYIFKLNMGIVHSFIVVITKRVDNIESKINKIRLETSVLNTRLAGVEKEMINHRLITDSLHNRMEEHSSKFLNLSLLEEGRSIYKPKRHTASVYM